MRTSRSVSLVRARAAEYLSAASEYLSPNTKMSKTSACKRSTHFPTRNRSFPAALSSSAISTRKKKKKKKKKKNQKHKNAKSKSTLNRTSIRHSRLTKNTSPQKEFFFGKQEKKEESKEPPRVVLSFLVSFIIDFGNELTTHGIQTSISSFGAPSRYGTFRRYFHEGTSDAAVGPADGAL